MIKMFKNKKFQFLAVGAIGLVPVVMMSCGITVNFDSKKPENKTPEKGQTDKTGQLDKKATQQSSELEKTQSNSQTTTEKNQSPNAKETQTNTNQKKPKLSREEALKKLRETKLPQLLPPTEYDKKLAKEKKQQEKAQFEELNGFVFILDGNRKYSINKYNLLDNGTYEPNPKVLNAMIEVDGKQIHQYIFSGGKIIPNPELKNIG